MTTRNLTEAEVQTLATVAQRESLTPNEAQHLSAAIRHSAKVTGETLAEIIRVTRWSREFSAEMARACRACQKAIEDTNKEGSATA